MAEAAARLGERIGGLVDLLVGSGCIWSLITYEVFCFCEALVVVVPEGQRNLHTLAGDVSAANVMF